MHRYITQLESGERLSWRSDMAGLRRNSNTEEAAPRCPLCGGDAPSSRPKPELTDQKATRAAAVALRTWDDRFDLNGYEVIDDILEAICNALWG